MTYASIHSGSEDIITSILQQLVLDWEFGMLATRNPSSHGFVRHLDILVHERGKSSSKRRRGGGSAWTITLHTLCHDDGMERKEKNYCFFTINPVINMAL